MPPRSREGTTGRLRTRMRRIGRNLLHMSRAVWDFPPPQNEESTVAIDEHSDADVAGCPKTRRSTSGGSLRVGRHALATWSSTQKQLVHVSSRFRRPQYGAVRAKSLDWPTRHATRSQSDQTLQQHEGRLSAVGVTSSNTLKHSIVGSRRKKKTTSSRSQRSAARSKCR